VPEAAGEVALEAADGFAGALAFGSFAVQVGAGLGVAAGAGDGDAMDRGVDLAVAAAVQAMAVGLAGADGDRRDAGGAGEFGVGREAGGAGDLADELGRRERPQAGLGEQLWRDLGDQVGDVALERLDRVRELAVTVARPTALTPAASPSSRSTAATCSRWRPTTTPRC
jgi:hypothetical protein